MKEEDIKKISQTFTISEDAIKKVLKKAATELAHNNKAASHRKVEPAHYYFLVEDFNKLNEKIEKIHNEIIRLGEAIGLSCDVSGETFHDNFDYEECGRQLRMWSQESDKLLVIRRQARIITPQTSNDLNVSIGRTVKININGQKMELKVGSYLTFSSESISYATPIIKLILGAKVNDVREGLIMDKKVRIKILAIE
jgi:transcription elongation GreA/GreB family factor